MTDKVPLPEPARVAPVLGVIQNVYTAEQMRAYAAADNAELRERVKVLEDAIALAYGHLWCINEEPGTPSPIYPAMDAAYAARNILRSLLTTEQRGDGINAARKATT